MIASLGTEIFHCPRCTRPFQFTATNRVNAAAPVEQKLKSIGFKGASLGGALVCGHCAAKVACALLNQECAFAVARLPWRAGESVQVCTNCGTVRPVVPASSARAAVCA